MTSPDVSLIVPARNAAAHIAPTLRSALQQQGASVEVVVADDASADQTLRLATSLARDPRLTALALPTPQGPWEACRQALARSSAELVGFLAAGTLCQRDLCSRARDLARATGADLVVLRPDQPERQTFEAAGPAGVAHAVFSCERAPLSLDGVFVTRRTALRAIDALAGAPADAPWEPVLLFALCCEASSAVIAPDPDPAPTPEAGDGPSPTGPEPCSLPQLQERSCAARAAAQCARHVAHRHGKEGEKGWEPFALHLMRPLVEAVPRRPQRDQVAQAFNLLRGHWDAPELTAAVARWRGNELLPFLEGVSSAICGSNRVTGHVERVALLCPGDIAETGAPGAFGAAEPIRATEPTAPVHHDGAAGIGTPRPMADVARTLRLLGAEALALHTQGTQAPSPGALSLPDAAPDGSFLRRAQALCAALQEHGVSALAAPLSGEPLLALDLLCAQLTGVPVMLLAPQGAPAVLGAAGSRGEAARLLATAQLADVIAVPSARNVRFWSMAAPFATAVPLVPEQPAEEYWSRLFDVLEAAEDPLADLCFRPSVFSSPMAALTRAMNAPAPAGTDAAQQRILQLEAQTAILEARLAEARDESRSLRQMLAEAGALPCEMPVAS